MKTVSNPPLLRTGEVQDRLRYQSRPATLAFLRRKGVQSIRRGRCLLWPADAVERLIAP